VLTRKEILAEVKKGRIMIDPFNESNVKSNSMDLRLDDKLKIYVDNDGAPIDETWRAAIKLYGQTTDPAGRKNEALYDFLERKGAILDQRTKPRLKTIDIPDEGYVIIPGRGYLGSTVETIRTDHFVPAMHGRSSMGRLFLSPHHTAGWGDTGFSGSWTLEITCMMPTRIYKGMRICQLSFETITGESVLYQDIDGSRYQGQKGPVESRMYNDFVGDEKPDGWL
jgi:dCTP deaminase